MRALRRPLILTDSTLRWLVLLLVALLLLLAHGCHSHEDLELFHGGG